MTPPDQHPYSAIISRGPWMDSESTSAADASAAPTDGRRCPFRVWLTCDGTPTVVGVCNFECDSAPHGHAHHEALDIVELVTWVRAPASEDALVPGCTACEPTLSLVRALTEARAA